jgi:hypothetical protein
MKSLIRLIVLVLICFIMAGTITSCAIFDRSKVTKQQSFKHKKPLPKRYVINQKSRPIAK